MSPNTPNRSRPWVVPVVTAAALAVLGAVADGLTGLLMVLGAAALVVGVVALVTRRWPGWVRGRKGGAAALVMSLGLFAGATATMPEGDRNALPTASVWTAVVDESAESHKPENDGAGAPTTPAPAPTSAQTPPPSEKDSEAPPGEVRGAGTALAAVGELEVKGRAPRTGYDRDRFGSGWVDVDRNGCDTRNDILARDLTAVVHKPGTNGCVVLSGTLADPFSGEFIAFVRGNDTSNEVQIDHLVALSDAWQKGAQQWDEAMRVAFANDPLNLLAVDGDLNQQKGDGDTATWLPPNKGFRCEYVARQVAVKLEYELWVTQAERDAMIRVLSACPEEPLPQGGAAASGRPAPGPTTSGRTQRHRLQRLRQRLRLPQPPPSEPTPGSARARKRSLPDTASTYAGLTPNMPGTATATGTG